MTIALNGLSIGLNAINIQDAIIRPHNIAKSLAIQTVAIEADKGMCDSIIPAGLHGGNYCLPVATYVLPILPTFGTGWTSRY